MKTKHTLLLILLSVIISSCKKDEEGTPSVPIVDTTEYFNCKINGVNYVNDYRFADYFQNTARVVAANDDELIRINMSKDTTGTFPITNTSVANSIVYIDSFENRYVSTSGSIVITEFNKSKQIASGTFSGELVNEKDANDKVIITEGKFNYIELLPF